MSTPQYKWQVKERRRRKEAGLCQYIGCKESSARRIIMQDKMVMKDEQMTHCFTHTARDTKQKVEYQRKNRAESKSCIVCHNNPAKLCEDCQAS